MNRSFLLIGLAFIILGIIALVLHNLTSGIIALIIGIAFTAYTLFIPSEKQITNKLKKGMSSALIDLAQKKINNGSLNADMGKFREIVGRMEPVLPKISAMPEIGYDSLYIHFSKESEAEDMIERLREMNLNVNVVQNKTDWAVKIEIS
ncbi:MAG: hypothetical protein M1129_05035 [Candidatus Thermoplasmatota archaeon]|nr:hypothetical protein [Candidatus Thermoplasmatota archaeon]